MIYRNVTVPIPSNGHLGTGNRIYIVTEKNYLPERKYNVDKRVSIGQAIDKDTMHPNDAYKTLFPAQFEETTGQKPRPVEVSIGLKVVTESICRKTGLYDCIDKAYGRQTLDESMDYCMYMLLCHSDVTQHLESALERRLLFSSMSHSDNHYSEAFSRNYTPEMQQDFMERWCTSLKARGVDSGYISIDGSNDECESQGIEIAEKGHNKLGTDTEIFNFMYAVAEDGTPIMLHNYRGSIVDSKALRHSATLMNAYGIRPKGGILDRGFCYQKCIDIMRENHIPYIMLLKGNTSAATQMFKEHAEDIRIKVDTKIEGRELFGTTDKKSLFDAGDEAYVHLYFDARNGLDRIFTLMDDFEQVLANAKSQLAQKKEISIPAKFKGVISYRQGRGPKTIEINSAKYQQLVDKKGFSAIATEKRMNATDADRIYHLRDASETQFAILKTQLGFDRVRVHSTPSLEAKAIIAFWSAIIRNEIMKAGKAVSIRENDRKNYTANAVIQELDCIRMTLINDKYCFVNSLSRKSRLVLEELGLSEDDFQEAARRENVRLEGKVPRARRKKPGRKKKS